MSDTEYAISGTHEEFQAWQEEDWETRKSVQRVTRPSVCYGKAGKLHRVGTWTRLPYDLVTAALGMEYRYVRNGGSA